MCVCVCVLYVWWVMAHAELYLLLAPGVGGVSSVHHHKSRLWSPMWACVWVCVCVLSIFGACRKIFRSCILIKQNSTYSGWLAQVYVFMRECVCVCVCVCVCMCVRACVCQSPWGASNFLLCDSLVTSAMNVSCLTGCNPQWVGTPAHTHAHTHALTHTIASACEVKNVHD